jgi:hypothetical protein
LAVGTIGLAGLLALVVTALRGNQVAAASAEAVEIAEESMEELRSMTIASIESMSSHYGPIDETGWGPVGHHGGDMFGRNNVRFKRTVEARQLPASIDSRLVWLRIDVEWADHGADLDTAGESAKHRVYLEMLRNREDRLCTSATHTAAARPVLR